MEPDVRHILSQPFFFLSEGMQSRAYESLDKRSVLKVFKTLDEGREQFKKWHKDPKEVTKEWFDNAEKSYALALKKLKDETVLIYVQPAGQLSDVSRVSLDGDLCDISERGFLLQEKVELVRERLENLMSKNDVEGSKKVIDDVCELIDGFWKREITEDTFNFDHNYGYARSGKLVQIDVGSLWEGKSHLREQLKAKILLKCVSAKWLEETYPNLNEYYKEKVNDLYKKLELYCA